MTNLKTRLEELLKLADAATPGPWKQDISPYPYGNQCYVQYSEVDKSTIVVGGYQAGKVNSEFIAASRTAVPALVRSLELALGALEYVRIDGTEAKTKQAAQAALNAIEAIMVEKL